MTKPSDKSKRNPSDRMRSIMSAMQKQRSEDRPLERLPKAALKTENRLPAPTAAQPAPASAPKPPEAAPKFQFLPAFWTVASIFSVIVNVILVAVLLGTLRGLGSLNFGGVGTGLLGGLYSNFEKMDVAHIKTTIPLQTVVPLKLSIPVQTTTSISLADPVEIPNAHVKISTGTFNIDSDADVTLPAGTALNVVLNFNVPVQDDVPISLNVPVDIALNKTELHPAIVGLEGTLRPWYCAVNPGAISLNNIPICR